MGRRIRDAAPSFEWDDSRATIRTRGVFTVARPRQVFRQALENRSVRVRNQRGIPIGDHVVVPHTVHVRGRDGIEASAGLPGFADVRHGNVGLRCLYGRKRKPSKPQGSRSRRCRRRTWRSFGRATRPSVAVTSTGGSPARSRRRVGREVHRAGGGRLSGARRRASLVAAEYRRDPIGFVRGAALVRSRRRGGDEVIVRARGVGSGAETTARLAHAIRVRNQKVVYVASFRMVAEALEALGLSEQDAHADS